MIRIKLTPSRIFFNIVNYSFFIVAIFLCLYPAWYLFIYSISNSSDIARYGISLIPRGINLVNYENVFKIKEVYHALLISVFRTVIGAFCTVTACTLLGYLFTKKEMPGRRFLYRMLIITMYVSGGLIPTYLTIQAYGLLNKFIVYILPFMVNAFYVILVKTYIEQLPESLEESARIDGANTFIVFLRIIAPLSIPIIATITVYSAVDQWNSWFDNHIYTFQNPNLLTLQYMLYRYLLKIESLMQQIKLIQTSGDIDISSMLTPKSLRMAITVVTVVPVLIVYPIMQRYFLKGIMLGAIKG
jgi:putative aldouronate transport system permease protein